MSVVIGKSHPRLYYVSREITKAVQLLLSCCLGMHVCPSEQVCFIHAIVFLGPGIDGDMHTHIPGVCPCSMCRKGRQGKGWGPCSVRSLMFGSTRSAFGLWFCHAALPCSN